MTNVLGHNSRRIESEYLERLHKVRFGMDRGWRPPGLMLKGGAKTERGLAIEYLKQLAEHDGFFCSKVTLTDDLSLRDTDGVCRAAIHAAGLSGQARPDADPTAEIKRLAASSRALGRNGWVLLIGDVDRFDGSPRERAESYRELTRWMGTLQGEGQVGLFCVLAVTPEFEAAVADPHGDLASIRDALRATGSPADLQLLDQAEAGIALLDHEATIKELLVLEM